MTQHGSPRQHGAAEILAPTPAIIHGVPRALVPGVTLGAAQPGDPGVVGVGKAIVMPNDTMRHENSTN
jgi:hypothetical protein